MQISEQAAQATQAVFKALDVSPQKDQSETVRRIIEDAMVARLRDCEERHTKAAENCCPEDRGLAQKISDEIRRSNEVLIANLSAMR